MVLKFSNTSSHLFFNFLGPGRRFGSWEQADDPDRVIQERKELDEFGKEQVTIVDPTESFFAELGDI